MKVAIHQPEHLPWLGFFHKISHVDMFIVLDNVQFRKNYFQNRNKILTAAGWIWITVPVSHGLTTKISDVLISENARWKDKWRHSIYLAYKRTRYFNDYFEELNKVITTDFNRLVALNMALIHLLCKFLDIKTKIVIASHLNVDGKGSKLILGICQKVGADIYLSGISGKEYLDPAQFKKENIEIAFQQFHHPIYKQHYTPFIPCMSAIDLLFNYGKKSLEIINGVDVPVMKDVLF